MKHIAYCTDSNYIVQTTVSVESLLANNRGNITIHLVYTDSEISASKVHQQLDPVIRVIKKYHCEFFVYSIDINKLSSFDNKINTLSKATYARLLLPDIINLSVEKILYIDCDTIICDSIEELWNFDISESPLAAVVDKNGNNGYLHKDSFVEQELPYYNAGVLLMNLDNWRKNNITEKTIRFISSYNPAFMDQAAINNVLKNLIVRLPFRNNIFVEYYSQHISCWGVNAQYLEEIKSSLENPLIIHYAGPHKPWLGDSFPQFDLWWHYYDLTGITSLRHVVKLQYTPLFELMENVYSQNTSLFECYINFHCRLFTKLSKFRLFRYMINMGTRKSLI